MKNIKIALVVLLSILLSLSVYSQSDDEEGLLGLPGDNLDLYAVLDLFQKSKTIEDFEKSINDEKIGINNLDLNLDKKIDFIKVETKQKGEDFTFILQVDVTEKETQDVAVILLSKDKDDKVTLQIVGDKDLYGKDYVIEPKPAAPAVTPNPAYTGSDPVKESVPDPTTVVIVESAPIVQYVYSPVYVPYYPPYYYGYYPPYFAAATVIAVGIYRHNHYYHHHGYHGGYRGGTVVVHNHNTYNNYNGSRNRSGTVNHYNSNGNYGNNGRKPSTNPSTRPSNPSAVTRPSNPSASQRQSSPSTSQRQSSPSASQRQSSSRSYSGSGRSGGSYSGGRSGGSYSGGSSRGGGRGGRR